MNRHLIEELRHIKCIKCMKLSLKQKRLLIYGLLSSLAGSGFMVILVGCATWAGGWWAIFVLFGIFLAPVPDIVFNRLCIKDEESEFHTKTDPAQRKHGCIGVLEDALFVMGGFFACIPFCLPLVLAHNQIISKSTSGMVISGSFLIMAASFIYTKFIYNNRLMQIFHKNIDEEEEYSSDGDGYRFDLLGRDEE